MSQNRIVTVDFTRGLLAIGVLFYHTLIYEGGPALPQIGRHGVYAFFVISGFALYTSYWDRLGSAGEIRSYLLARFWRIAPLYYTATVISILVFGTEDLAWSKVFFNVTFLMGFANPGGTSMVVGGWSIGIEMVFYALFPVLVPVCAGKLLRLGLLTGTLLVGQIIFANHVLGGTALINAWVAYTQPIAFAGYFAGGCLLAECYRRQADWKGSWVAWLTAIVSLLAFAAAPADSETILTGIVGAGLTLAALAFVCGVAFMHEPRGVFRDFAEWIGRLSYPVYLLHPIVYHFVAKFPLAEVHILGTLFATLALSDVVNRVVERPAIRYARQLRGEAPT